MTSTRTRIALGIAAALILSAGAAQAQSSLGIGAAEPSIAPVGFGGALIDWVNQKQQGFYRALTGALKAMRTDPWQMWGLVSLSFLYGVFHAAGPGHGKAVISSYMIANEVALRRGVLLSLLSSLLQAVTAIAVVTAAYFILRGAAISLTQATRFLETSSYALVAAFGFWLLSRKLLSLYRPAPLPSGLQPAAALAHGATGPAHTHDHAHGHHHHHATDGACSTCGHAHMPDPKLISGNDMSLREAWGAVIAVGLRPCSGALIVLTFSILNGLWLAGVASAFAMAIGTAITVSALATLAVTAKGVAVRLSGAAMGGRVATAIELLGATLVLALGVLLFTAALQT